MMADCELIQGCIFFNNKMQGMPATAELLKNRYCKGAFTTCARHMVFKAMGRPSVPPDLFPQQTEIAEEIIKAG